MNNETLMITAEYLRDNTSLTANIDGTILVPYIIVAQNLHIESILGTAMFNEVITDIRNNTVTGVIKTLLDDYLQPTLAQWSFYEALPFIKYSISNIGVSSRDAENANEVDLEELQFIRGVIKDTAEYMSQRVINYLKENVALYPSYQNYNNIPLN